MRKAADAPPGQADEGELSLSGIVPLAHAMAEQMAASAVLELKDSSESLSCAKGCAACCRYLVRVSIPEAFYFAERLAELPPDRQAASRARIEAVAARLRVEGLAPDLERDLERPPGDVGYDTRLHHLARRYHALDLACPFLEDEACSIYEWRPATCRQYLVTSPSALCAEPFTRNVRLLGQRLPAVELLARIASELLGVESTTLALPLALRWAERHAAEGRRRWPSARIEERLYELAGLG